MQVITRNRLETMNEEAKEDFVLVNVLPREEFNKAHIRTSVNVPHESDDFAERVERIAGSKARPVVVYCASLGCDASTRAATKLEEAGFENVFDYEGGTRDWLENH